MHIKYIGIETHFREYKHKDITQHVVLISSGINFRLPHETMQSDIRSPSAGLNAVIFPTDKRE